MKRVREAERRYVEEETAKDHREKEAHEARHRFLRKRSMDAIADTSL